MWRRKRRINSGASKVIVLLRLLSLESRQRKLTRPCSQFSSRPFEIKDAPYPDTVKSLPHVAFEVDDLARALEGKEILVEPNCPSPGEVIVLCVRWYLRYPLSYEHVSELLEERGVEVDPSCIWRWVQAYAPELNKRCRPFLKPTNKSYRIDETYIKVKGQDKYLYRALDSTGQTIEFLLTAKRDKAAAKRFLVKAIEASGNPMPRVMNVDKNPAYPAAMEELKAEGVIPRRVALRQCKYLNNVIEQDHRSVKKRVWLAKGYGSFQSAWRTLQGIETVNMIRKGRVRWLPKEDAVGQAIFISELFGLAAV